MNKKADIILTLLTSLNAGNSGYVQERVRYAIAQYSELVEKGIIKEEADPHSDTSSVDVSKLFRPPVGPL
jgi:hypothetical protein